MKLSHESMKDFMTDQLNRIFMSEKVVVTKVVKNGDYFDVEFYPASEILQESIEKRPDLPKAEDFKKK
jgi:hypothetical protein